jgi:CHAT domain-containing protein
VGATLAIEEAREALRLAEAEPERAAALSAGIVTRAQEAGDLATAAVAERAWGLALRHRGDVDSAITHLRAAIRLATRAGTPDLAAEARMTLAFALAERGRPAKALAEIDLALRDLTGVAGARALTQRGTILLELGRYGEAVADYRAALPELRDAGDLLWQYRVLSNRGLANAYRHAFAAAETDLREAERLAVELDLPLTVGFARANLAFVMAARGDVPAALDYFDRAEEQIRAHDAQVGSLLQDRAELLLSVRLVAEARETAGQAVAELERERRAIKLPEVRLLLAQAAFLDGDNAIALHHARRAADEFAKHRRPEWAALARLAMLRSECAGPQRATVSLRRVEQVVRALAAAGWPAACLEGRLLAAGLLLERGELGRGRAHLREASRARFGTGPATLRARAWYAEAKLRASLDDSRGARSAIRAGLRVLDRHRAVLGATDLRAHVAGHRTELTDVGLRIALDDGRPRRVFEWAERGRASHLLQRPIRPPRDEQLADALAELRATVAEINGIPGTGPDSGKLHKLVQRQVMLERQIRDRSRLWRGETDGELPDPVRPEAAAAALETRALVQYVQLDGVLHAITLVDGRIRLRTLGPMAQADDLVGRIPFALHRINRHERDTESQKAAHTLLRFAAERLDALLLRPLGELADRPLVLVPTGALQNVPWSLLPSCAGRPVTVSPSATLWHAATGRTAPSSAHVAVAAGPTLPGAGREATAVAEVYHTTALLHPSATVEAVLSSLNGAAVAHLAAHGRLSAHNPLFSDLLLSDGPMLAYDLEGLEHVPHTAILAACDSGRSVVCTGDELLGLSATFLARGTAQLVASVLPILDAETAPLMVEFHRLLAGGQPPAAALAAAQERISADETTMAAAVGFVCVGSGFTSPPL